MSISASLSIEEILELASAERDAGRLDEAERLYRSILRENPQDAAARKELHRLLKDRSKLATEARRRNKPARNARLAKAGSPSGPETKLPAPVTEPGEQDIQTLISLYRAGLLCEAETKARQLIKKFPRALVLFDVLSGTLIGQDKLEEAIASCRQALQIKPDYAEAHSNLGAALIKFGKLEDAIASYRQALKIRPDYAVALNNLGFALNSLGKHDEAVGSYRQALKITPEYAAALQNLGNALVNLGKFEEAASSFQKALAIQPDFSEALKNLGNLYERTNKIEEAEACIQKALHISPNDPAVNRAWAVLLRRQGKITEAIQTLERFTGEAVPDKVLSEIHSELGKLYDREHDSKKAFHHFAITNDLRVRAMLSTSFRKEKFLSEVQQSAHILTSNRSDRWVTPVRQQEVDRPVFLVGFPRSGTTLLDQILDCHPSLQVMDEKPIMHGIKLKISTDFDDYPTAFSLLDAAEIQDLRDCYFQDVTRYVEREPATLLVDKFPLNIAFIPLIIRLFPDARIVLALRHPCDVVLSNFMQSYKINDAMANFFTLADSVHCYSQVMSLWQQCVALLPMTYHTVRYEAVVTNFESEVRALLEFLEVDWDDAVLDYSMRAKEKEIINTPSYQAVTEPINTRAKFRWMRYREQLEPVLDDLLPFIDAFGYSDAGAAGEVS